MTVTVIVAGIWAFGVFAGCLGHAIWQAPESDQLRRLRLRLVQAEEHEKNHKEQLKLLRNTLDGMIERL